MDVEYVMQEPFLMWVSLVVFLGVLPMYWWSLEHRWLENRLGKERGSQVGSVLGLVSGWGFFGGLIGIWASPQPRFGIWFLEVGPVVMGIPVVRVVVGLLGIVPGAWFGIQGVQAMSLRVAETHRPTMVVETGVYTMIRHPQYVGACLAHLGITLVLGAWYSLACTPLVVGVIWVLAWKEEQELVREFGSTYQAYQGRTGRFLPRRTTPRDT